MLKDNHLHCLVRHRYQNLDIHQILLKCSTGLQHADLGGGEVMCVMNCTNMEEMGKFMSSPEEMQWDKYNGAVYKAYLMEEMGG